MKLFNTLTNKLENFVPLEDGKVKFYLCGPTVYDVAHLGHGRSAVSFDVIRRYFIYKGYDVTFVSNYTDIDDKMIARANELNISVSDLADKIIPEYESDYEKLGILKPDVQPRATDFINDIIEIIKKLELNEMIYTTSDGVYFDISKFNEYGKLSKQKIEDLKVGIRIDVNAEKRNPQDFVLWKFYKDGEPFWDSPWGKGRPGWHIECSAMCWKILGESFDIHAGGSDLMFPHHECEIAQSESAFKVDFVKYWLHNAFVMINKEKMSKSLNNFFTLKEIFNKFNPLVIRYLFLHTHYRSPIDFSLDSLVQAKNSLERLNNFLVRLNDYVGVDVCADNQIEQLIDSTKSCFEDSMDNDFDTPKALACVFNFVKQINLSIDKKSLSKTDKNNVISLLKSLNEVFVIFDFDVKTENEEINNLIKKRDIAREQKDYKLADEIREILAEKGVILHDSLDGTTWEYKK